MYLSVVFYAKCNTRIKAKAPRAVNRLVIVSIVCYKTLNAQMHPMHHDMQQSVFHITTQFTCERVSIGQRC